MRVFLCLLLAGPASCGHAPRADGAAPPNILFIMADDLGWKDLRCQGRDAFRTPHLDALAAAGMRFTQAYAAAPVCSPTRAAALTGLAPARLKVTNHNPDRWSFYEDSDLGPGKSSTHLDSRHETVAEVLRRRGYATGFFGKWHLSHGDRPDPRQLPEGRGFDVNVGGNSWGGPGGPGSFFDPFQIPLPSRQPGQFLTDRLADEVVDFLRRSAGRPFFACLWTYAVHWPIEAPPELVAKHGEGGRERYRAMVEALDRGVGRVLRGLEELGLSGRTLVVFTSDNGPLLDYTEAAPLKGMKGHLSEGGLRVPLLARWPGRVPAGAVCDVPVVTMDLVPTFLEAAGIPFEAGRYDGESLRPLLRREGTRARRSLYFHYPHKAYHRRNRMGSAVREGDYKLLKFYGAGGPELELYDLRQDPGETRDLAPRMPELVRALEERLDLWLARTGAEKPRPFAEIADGELVGARPK